MYKRQQQECYIAHASNAGSVSDLNTALSAEDTTARKGSLYLPIRSGFSFSRSVPNPTVANPNVWRLTRTWSTDAAQITDWEYSGILREDKTAITYPQECYVLHAANAGSPLELSAALTVEDTTARKDVDFLPSRPTANSITYTFSESPPNPTANNPNVWRLTRIWSMDENRITDWSYSGIILSLIHI